MKLQISVYRADSGGKYTQFCYSSGWFYAKGSKTMKHDFGSSTPCGAAGSYNTKTDAATKYKGTYRYHHLWSEGHSLPA